MRRSIASESVHAFSWGERWSAGFRSSHWVGLRYYVDSNMEASSLIFASAFCDMCFVTAPALNVMPRKGQQQPPKPQHLRESFKIHVV